MPTHLRAGSEAWFPFRIEPSFAARVWGFGDLHPWYDIVSKDDEPIGEAWLTGDECVISTGIHAGQTLGALFAENSRALLGKSAVDSASPLLIKVIFAKEKLSVQVHPDDKMAQKYGEPRGKTECWYVLSAEPGAQVACGLKHGVTLEDVKAGINADTLEESLKTIDVDTGDMIFVDAGTVHAIWPGAILLETQQNCDLTYRMYDYGRGRELHIERSLEATRLTTSAGKVPAQTLPDRTVLVKGDYFRVETIPVDRARFSGTLRSENEIENGLAYLFAASGKALIKGDGFDPVELPMGSIVAIPAASPEFVIEDRSVLDPGRPRSNRLKLMRISPCFPPVGQ